MSQWLISAEQLAGCYQQSDVVVIDCRFSLADTEEGYRAYADSHIDGAFYLHVS